MMLLQHQESLDELIIRCLAHAARMTAQQLQEAVAKRSRRYSLQGIYKELAKLQKMGVVVRVQGTFSLSLSWATSFVNLGDVIYDIYLNGKTMHSVSDEALQKKTWTCFDFFRFAHFWFHTTLAILNDSKERTVYSFQRHPWMHLIANDQYLLFEKALRINKQKQYLIVGNDSFLDRMYANRWDKRVVEHSFSDSPFHSEVNRGKDFFLTVVGNYVFRMRLDKKTEDDLEAFYQQTKSAKDIRIDEITSFFHRKAKFKVALEHDEKKAARARKKFEQYFLP